MIGAAALCAGCLPWSNREKAPIAPAAMVEATAASQASANDCDLTVTKASAWVNRMPGAPDRPPPKLRVQIRVADQDGPLRMTRIGGTPDGPLILDLSRDADESLGRAGARYEETAPVPGYTSVFIHCGGARIAHIETIKTVY